MSDSKRSCLIVDDSKIVRKVSRKILEPMGFECSEAEDGQQALDHCKQSFPFLIMLDWHMPVMDGLEFLKEVRALDGGSEPIIIFCTTETEFSKIQEAVMSGANEYVMKPFDESIIRGKLEQLGIL
ncbi:MAG: response regulator [Rickettsiales bacterium]|nr:response regulator [Rickettsiales bacterium]